LTTRPLGALHRSRFDHVGVPTSEAKDGAVWLEADGVWVTSPRAHPLNVEWVRYAADSSMHPRLRSSFHVAYRVDDVRRAVEGHEVLVPPRDVGGGFATIAFVDVDGLVVELIEYADPDEEGWIS
jgi:catechol 2,3-dioxygenase-like lactoylglutathione lyase family enzyme